MDIKTATLDELRAAMRGASTARWGEPGYAEQSKRRRQIEDAAIERFAEFGLKPEDPDCRTCKVYATFGPSLHPRHEASRSCQSGRRPHCTCDTCF